MICVMDNEVIVLLFIVVLFFVVVIKYKEGMNSNSSLDPQSQTNEHQGIITNLHDEIEKLNNKISIENLNILDSKITILEQQTTELTVNIPEQKVKKYNLLNK